jgi:hypothetical protein
MAESNLNEFLGFLNHPQGDIAMCKATFGNDGLACPILGGANNILPNMMSQQILKISSRNDACKIIQRSIHSLSSADGENLKAYQDITPLTKYDAEQYAYVASLKINEADGVKGVNKLVSNFMHCWSHPMAQAHITGITALTDTEMGNISTGAVAGRIGNHNNCMSIHCPFVLNAAHFTGDPLPVVDGLIANVEGLKLCSPSTVVQGYFCSDFQG